MLSEFLNLFNFADVGDYLPDLLRGALISVELTICVMLLSLVAGLLLALGKIGRQPVIRFFCNVYIEVIRGTPALLQLFYIYFVLPSLGIRFDPFLAGVIGLSVNYSAYLAEVYRAGIEAVPKGQVEAAKALGMSRRKLLRVIVLPQAIQRMVPAFTNRAVELAKTSSLASVLSVHELMYQGRLLSSTYYRPLEILTVVALTYFVLIYPFSYASHRLEQRLGGRL